MDKKLLRTLKKLYHYSNGVYDRERQVTLYQVDTLTAAEQELLQFHHWNVNDIVQIEHDDIIDKLIALQQNETLSWRTITDAFIAGVGGSYPRGISTLASYHMMIHTTPHTYEEADKFLMCKVCGFSHRDQGWENISWIRYAIHSGIIMEALAVVLMWICMNSYTCWRLHRLHPQQTISTFSINC